MVAYFLPLGLSVWEAALLAAILTPTDAALGQAVVENEIVPERIRRSLNVESGLNDGIALPVILILASVASAMAGNDVGSWVQFALAQLTLGPAAGVLVGFFGARLLNRADAHDWVSESGHGMIALVLAGLSFLLAEALGGNGFIAAFAAGLVFGDQLKNACHSLFEFVETEGQLLTLGAFFIFGALLLPNALTESALWISPWHWLFAFLSLTLLRMLPMALSLVGLRLSLPSILFLGWFGPRGLASILFMLVVMKTSTLPHMETITNIVFIAVLLSVLLHGLTAAPLARKYGLKYTQDESSLSDKNYRSIMKQLVIKDWNELTDRKPAHAVVGEVDLVVIRYDDSVSVLYGRCAHRGALMSDGYVRGDNLICGVHGWDYRVDTGISEYNNAETLPKFKAWIDDEKVCVDEDEIRAFAEQHPQPYNRNAYQGIYQDPVGTPDEPHVKLIRELAANGLTKTGGHGAMAAMGVSWRALPKWGDLQFVTAQLATPPLLDDAEVDSELIIGGGAKKPLRLQIPLFVSDMSFGALSQEAKVALARGAELAGTGICAGEGGMLPEEQAANGRYFYELASARFGFAWDKVRRCQAFHFKGGQGAKTGTGGHLPGKKVGDQNRRGARLVGGSGCGIAGTLSGLERHRANPRFRRRSARANRRHSGRL